MSIEEALEVVRQERINIEACTDALDEAKKTVDLRMAELSRARSRLQAAVEVLSSDGEIREAMQKMADPVKSEGRRAIADRPQA